MGVGHHGDVDVTLPANLLLGNDDLGGQRVLEIIILKSVCYWCHPALVLGMGWSSRQMHLTTCPVFLTFALRLIVLQHEL